MHRIIRFASIALLLGAAWTPTAPSAYADEAEVCGAGGAGAESCEASAGTVKCNVTCQDGYYACCGWSGGGPGCRCVPINAQ